MIQITRGAVSTTTFTCKMIMVPFSVAKKTILLFLISLYSLTFFLFLGLILTSHPLLLFTFNLLFFKALFFSPPTASTQTCVAVLLSPQNFQILSSYHIHPHYAKTFVFNIFSLLPFFLSWTMIIPFILCGSFFLPIISLFAPYPLTCCLCQLVLHPLVGTQKVSLFVLEVICNIFYPLWWHELFLYFPLVTSINERCSSNLWCISLTFHLWFCFLWGHPLSYLYYFHNI